MMEEGGDKANTTHLSVTAWQTLVSVIDALINKNYITTELLIMDHYNSSRKCVVT